MSQHDFDISTSDANTGSTMRAAINAALQALASQNSGTTAPGTTYPYMVWIDTSTSPKTVRARNSANTAWIVTGTLSDAGVYLAADSSKVGGFAASQTPGASQVPVTSAASDISIAGTIFANGVGKGVRVKADGTTTKDGGVWADALGNIYLANYAGTRGIIVHGDGTFADVANNVFWHSGNDGAGSGLDADLLDGQQGSYYQPVSTLGTAVAGLSSFSRSLATSGYQYLPGGLILQWGVVSIGDVASGAYGTTSSLTFPLTFPTSCFTVLPSKNGDSVAAAVGARSITASGCQLYAEEWSGSVQNMSIAWLAIGH